MRIPVPIPPLFGGRISAVRELTGLEDHDRRLIQQAMSWVAPFTATCTTWPQGFSVDAGSRLQVPKARRLKPQTPAAAPRTLARLVLGCRGIGIEGEQRIAGLALPDPDVEQATAELAIRLIGKRKQFLQAAEVCDFSCPNSASPRGFDGQTRRYARRSNGTSDAGRIRQAMLCSSSAISRVMN